MKFLNQGIIKNSIISIRNTFENGYNEFYKSNYLHE